MENLTSNSGDVNSFTTEDMITSVTIFAIGIIGCSLAVIALGKEFFTGKSSTLVIVAALTWVDLVGVLSSSILIFHGFIIKGKWIGGFPQCQIQAFFSTVCGLSSGSIVTFMAVDRAISLYKPFYYKTIASPPLARGICVATVTLCFAIACLPFMGIGRYTVSRNGYFCQFDWYSPEFKYKAFILVCAVFASTIISSMLVSNVLVFLLVWRLRKVSRLVVPRHVSMRTQRKCQSAQKEEQMAKFVATVSLLFLCTWLPVTVRFFCNVYGTLPSDTADLTSMKLAILGFVVNPFVYVLFRKIFTRSLSRNISRIKVGLDRGRITTRGNSTAGMRNSIAE